MGSYIVESSFNIVVPPINIVAPTFDIVGQSLNIVAPTFYIVEPSINIVAPTFNIVEPSLNIVAPKVPIATKQASCYKVAQCSTNPKFFLKIWIEPTEFFAYLAFT